VVAAGLLASLAVPLGLLNGNLVRFDLVANSLGEPRLASFTDNPALISGFLAPKQINRYDWSKQYFGRSSTWLRYNYNPSSSSRPASGLWTSTSIVADVVSTSDRSRFSVYGLEACYNFHRFAIDHPQTIDLGGGVTGTVLAWHDGKNGLEWTTIYWHWPVKENGHIRYERMVLMLPDNGRIEVQAPDSVAVGGVGSRLNDALGRGRLGDAHVSERQRLLRRFLVVFAREIVQNQPAAPKVQR
jgi:hypothetical protein